MLLLHVVPELALGEDWVAGEDPDAVEGRVGVGLSWVLSAHHKVLKDLHNHTQTPKQHTFFCIELTPTPFTISFSKSNNIKALPLFNIPLFSY